VRKPIYSSKTKWSTLGNRLNNEGEKIISISQKKKKKEIKKRGKRKKGRANYLKELKKMENERAW